METVLKYLWSFTQPSLALGQKKTRNVSTESDLALVVACSCDNYRRKITSYFRMMVARHGLSMYELIN